MSDSPKNNREKRLKKKIALGVDLGGTKIRAGLVHSDGRTLDSFLDVPTEAHRTRAVVENHIFEAIEKTLERHSTKPSDIVGIGVGSPGPLDLKSGIILNAPNLPSLRKYPLKQRIADRYAVPVFVDNDGNCFTLGESLFSLKNKASIVAGLTLGTGVGCGIVMTGTAAELWKTPFRGKTVDEMLSGRGLQSLYQKRAGIETDAQSIARAAGAGDLPALEAWQEYGTRLGEILALIINVLDPDAVIIGGSLSHAWMYFQETMMAAFRIHTLEVPRGHVRILPSRLGDAGGYIGAAALCFSDESG
jgi:glucokinase